MSGEILYSFTAAPAKEPELRPGAGRVELRLSELPTDAVASNAEQDAIEMRFTEMRETKEVAWSLMRVTTTSEHILAGGFRTNMREAFDEALPIYEQALEQRRLPRRGFVWAVIDTWTVFTRIGGRTTRSSDDHVLKGDAAPTLRAAFRDGAKFFKKSQIRKAG
jgi:hypothetical protein